MKITFLLQRNKINKAGLTPLRCRITLERQRKQFSTRIFINPDYWSQEQQKVWDIADNYKTVNTQLSLIPRIKKKKIFYCYR